MKFSEEIMAKPTRIFSEAINERKKKKQPIYSFGLGEPDFKTPKYVVDACWTAIEEGYTHYCDAQGLLELRILIANSYNKKYGIEVLSSEVAITPGIKSAAYSALTVLLEPEDKVILCTPCYVAYPAMIKLAEPSAEIITLDYKEDYTFDLKKFKEIIKLGIKVLIINSPNNPTGAILSRKEIEEIVELCLKYNVYILSDEVYDEIIFYNNKHISFLEYPEIKDKLVVVNGYSKSHAMTGWRLGFAIASNNICIKISRLQFNTNTNVTTFIQKGACSIYEHEWKHIINYNKELEKRMELFHEGINSCYNLSGILPKGGFFYFVNITKTGMLSNEFSAKLVLETGIATTPGIAFGINWDGYIRFSLAVPTSQIEFAIKTIKEFMVNNFK